MLDFSSTIRHRFSPGFAHHRALVLHVGLVLLFCVRVFRVQKNGNKKPLGQDSNPSLWGERRRSEPVGPLDQPAGTKRYANHVFDYNSTSSDS